MLYMESNSVSDGCASERSRAKVCQTHPTFAALRIRPASFSTTAIFPSNPFDLPSGYQQYEGDSTKLGGQSTR